MIRRAAPQVGGRRGPPFLVPETMLDVKTRTSTYDRLPHDHSDERSRKMHLEHHVHAPILARTHNQMIEKGVVFVSSTLGDEHDNIERMVAVSDGSLYAIWRRREKTYVVCSEY